MQVWRTLDICIQPLSQLTGGFENKQKKSSITLQATPVIFLVEQAETSAGKKRADDVDAHGIQRVEASLSVNIIFQCSHIVTWCAKCSKIRVDFDGLR